MRRTWLWFAFAALLMVLVHLLPRTTLSFRSVASVEQIEASAERAARERGLTGDASVKLALVETDAQNYLEWLEGTAFVQQRLDEDEPLFFLSATVRSKDHPDRTFSASFAPSGRMIGFRDALVSIQSRLNERRPIPTREEAVAQAERALRDLGYPLDDFEQITVLGGLTQRVEWLERQDIRGARQSLAVELDPIGVVAVHHGYKLPDDFGYRWSQLRALHELLLVPGHLCSVLLWSCALLVALALRGSALAWREGALLAVIITVVTRSFDDTFEAFASAVAADAILRDLQPRAISPWVLLRPSRWACAPVQREIAVGLALCAGLLLYQQAYFAAAIALDAYVPVSAPIAWRPPGLVPEILTAAAQLRPGILEELEFRGILLGGALLLIRRWGRGPLWIALALFLQAFFFASAHTNYPQSPPWIRLLELLPFAALFGLVFLRAGLVPVMVAHTLFDVWHGLQDVRDWAPGWYALALLLFALPLLPTLLGRASEALPEDARAGAPRPPEPAPEQRAPRVPAAFAPIAALVGAAVLAFALARFERAQRLDCLQGCESYAEAVAAARAATGVRGPHVSAELLVIDDRLEDVYRKFLGQDFDTYRARPLSSVHPPGWRISLRRLGDRDGEVHIVERIPRPWGVETSIQRHDYALSWGMRAAGDGDAFPDEGEALALCRGAIPPGLDIPPSDAPEMSSHDLPARRDWALIWSDPASRGLPQIVCALRGGGEPHLSSGDHYGERASSLPALEERHAAALRLCVLLSIVWLYSLRGPLDARPRGAIGIALALVLLGLPMWPLWLSGLDPTRSFATHIALALPSWVSYVTSSALAASVTARLAARQTEASPLSPLLWGVGLGTAFGALPFATAPWSGEPLPWLSISMSPALSHAAVLLWEAWLLGLLFLAAAPPIRRRGIRGLAAAIVLCVALAGLGLSLRFRPEDAAIGVAALLLAECAPAIPWFAITFAALRALPLLLDPVMPGAREGSLIGIAAGLAIAALTSRALSAQATSSSTGRTRSMPPENSES